MLFRLALQKVQNTYKAYNVSHFNRMRPILKKKQTVPLQLKIAGVALVILVLLLLMLNLNYAGKKKEAFPELTVDVNIRVPVCNSDGGFHTESFPCALTTAPATTIYYTTDGSCPSLASMIYTKPFIVQSKADEQNRLSDIPTSPRWKPPISSVFKGTVVRAIAVTEDNRKSAEFIRTFFVMEKGRDRYSLPVIALTVNEEDLFGYKKGVYVLGKNYDDKNDYIKKNRRLDSPWWEYPSNYLKRGDNSERPVHIEFYEVNGKLGFSENAGVRINGNATRGFAQKSLRICFNKKTGIDQLTYHLFPGYSIQKFNSFLLRNSGNDWDKTMFRDAFMQSLMQNSGVDIQRYQPSIVFINGEYWGLHNIRDRFDENYIANKYKCAPDSVTILELSGQLVHGSKKDEDAFAKLIDFVQKKDAANDENYKFITSKMDIKSFSDFIIVNVFFCNSDWPNNNVKFWKYQAITAKESSSALDGRWRWMLYDLDWGCGYNTASTPQTDLLSKAVKVGSIGILFGNLLKNKSFSDFFIARFQHHLDSTFYTPIVLQRINEFQSIIDPEMKEHINRWRAIGSYDKWLDNIETMRKFVRERPSFQEEQLNSFFNLRNNEQIHVRK
jgi:hypothetical protein